MIIGTAREQEIGAWSKPWNKSGMKSGGKGAAAAESLVTQLRKSQLIRIPREGQQDRKREGDDGYGLGFPIGRKELGLVGQSIFKGPNFAAHLRRPSASVPSFAASVLPLPSVSLRGYQKTGPHASFLARFPSPVAGWPVCSLLSSAALRLSNLPR